MTTIAIDYKGRQLSLLARVARITNGTRYVTRKSVAKVVRGEAKYTNPKYCNSQAPHGWPSKVSVSRVKIGCHVFTGQNARLIREWATA